MCSEVAVQNALHHSLSLLEHHSEADQDSMGVVLLFSCGGYRHCRLGVVERVEELRMSAVVRTSVLRSVVTSLVVVAEGSSLKTEEARSAGSLRSVR